MFLRDEKPKAMQAESDWVVENFKRHCLVTRYRDVESDLRACYRKLKSVKKRNAELDARIRHARVI